MNHSRVLAYDDMAIKELVHGVQIRKSGGKINKQHIVKGHSPHHRRLSGHRSCQLWHFPKNPAYDSV
jgi:hypothetical protein